MGTDKLLIPTSATPFGFNNQFWKAFYTAEQFYLIDLEAVGGCFFGYLIRAV